jgi:hypothetical protein
MAAMKTSAVLLSAMILAGPQSAGNLVRNGDARMGTDSWTRLPPAGVEGSGDTSHFVLRLRGQLRQVIELPDSAAGQYLVIIGRGAADRVNADGSITGLPYLYGLLADETGKRYVSHLQGMRARPSYAGEWVWMSGIFPIPEDAARLILQLSIAQRAGDPQNGSAARFDDVTVHVVRTEEEARRFVAERTRTTGVQPENSR